MWGFIAALISGALMSIQGGDEADQPVGVHGMGAAVCVCGLRAGMAVYRAGKYCSSLAGG